MTSTGGGFFTRKTKAIRSRPRIQKRTQANIRTAGFLGIETKFYDTSLIGSALTFPTDASGGEHNPSATICLNSVVQGDGESQRDGRKISMLSMHVKGTVLVPSQVNQTVPDAGGDILIALVHDKQTNGTLLDSETVFVNPGADALTANQPFLNLQYRERFQVLATQRLNLRDPNTAWDGTNMEQQGYTLPFEMYKSLNGMTVTYKGTTESIANIVDNSLSIIAYGNAAGLAPTMSYNARLRFRG